MAVAVVSGALLRVAQNAVSLGGLLELVLGGGVVGMVVRVELPGQPPVGRFDVRFTGFAADT
jgi:hypothetical protein